MPPVAIGQAALGGAVPLQGATGLLLSRLQYLEAKIGKTDVARLTQPVIYDAMDKNKHRVRFANYIPTAISMLSKQAIRKRWRLDNPAIDIEPLKVPKSRKKPHLSWPDWAVDKMRSEGSEIPRLIFEIGVGSVQRPGDWVGFTWVDYDGISLTLRQNKTDKPLSWPCTAALKAAVDHAKANLPFAPHPSRHILARADGSAMSYYDVARIMLAERKRLGLQAFDQHALRYRGVMELAWAECTDDEIAAAGPAIEPGITNASQATDSETSATFSRGGTGRLAGNVRIRLRFL